jgi:cell wall-associated NlpC family hydrolase
MTHWATAYIGTPWVAGDSDCWNLARRVWREHFAREVPSVIVDAASPLAGRRAFRDADLSQWTEVQSPREGDAVLMARADAPCHVGIWLAFGAVLHSVEGAGVICTPQHRLGDIGYRITGFYRWSDA